MGLLPLDVLSKNDRPFRETEIRRAQDYLQDLKGSGERSSYFKQSIVSFEPFQTNSNRNNRGSSQEKHPL